MRVNAHPPSEAGNPGGDLRRILEHFDVGVVVRRMQAGLGQLPAYTNFPWPVDRGAVVRWNVDLTLRWMINGIAAVPDVQDREADRPVAQGSAGPHARAARGHVGDHFWGRAVCLGEIIQPRRWLGPLYTPGVSVPGRAARHRA